MNTAPRYSTVMIDFAVEPTKIEPQKAHSALVFTLPKTVSTQLPSRGLVMVTGAINGVKFRAPLEPDGQGSHWFSVNGAFIAAAKLTENTSADISMSPTKEWPEPQLPTDLSAALADNPQALAAWQSITPIARWDWIRWMEAVVLAETRKERPQKLCSMLMSGKRRPCCFNRAIKTPPKPAEIIL